jgi:regulator of CtrA degradation
MTERDGESVAWAEAETVAFGERLASSESFLLLFREGMSLIEETASYLDVRGRQESRNLARSTSLAYATESMRLTTRLMQLASWLLLQRAVNEGELTRDQAKIDKAKMKVGGLGASEATPAVEELPATLRALIDRSLRLQERIIHLDRLIYGEAADVTDAKNPVGQEMSKLVAAFGRKPS